MTPLNLPYAMLVLAVVAAAFVALRKPYMKMCEFDNTSTGVGTYLLISVAMVLPMWSIVPAIALIVFAVTSPIVIARRLLHGAGTTPPLRMHVVQATGDGDAGAAHSSSSTGAVATGTCTGFRGTLLFIHGFPDSSDLWKHQVPFFAANGYRCLVVDLPGFYDEGGGSRLGGGGWGYDFDTITEMLSDELERLLGEELQRGERVTLFLHDWGCGYGYYLQHRYPELVKGIIALDIGDTLFSKRSHDEATAVTKLYIAAYQLMFALLFLIGGAAGRLCLQLLMLIMNYSARPYHEVTATMMYPYYYCWLSQFQGTWIDWQPDLKQCPIFFAFATAKTGMFHTETYLRRLEATPKCDVVKFDCDHWIPLKRPKELNKRALAWLTLTQSSES